MLIWSRFLCNLCKFNHRPHEVPTLSRTPFFNLNDNENDNYFPCWFQGKRTIAELLISNTSAIVFVKVPVRLLTR